MLPILSPVMRYFLHFFFWKIIMFRWAIIFAVVALVASLLGFGGVAGMSADFAWIFLVVAVILAIVAMVSRGKIA